MGSITNDTLPGNTNAGRAKRIDFPDPVGCTTTTSLPSLTVVMLEFLYLGMHYKCGLLQSLQELNPLINYHR